MTYNEKVAHVVKTALARYAEIDSERAKAKEMFDSGEVNPHWFNETNHALNISRGVAEIEARDVLLEIAAAYKAALEKKTELSGDMLHEDANLLRTPGIKLTQHQFEALVEKHKDNPLMTQLLGAYQGEHPELHCDPVPTLDDLVSAKSSAFDKYVEAAIHTLANPEGMAESFLSGSYTPKGAGETTVLENEEE